MELLKVSIGNCELYHADCMDVLPLLQCVSHVVTDPPYEEEAHTKARRQLSKVGPGGRRIDKLPIGFDRISDELRASVGKEIHRLSDGWSVIFCQVEAVHLWKAALAGASYRRTGVWVKPDGAPQFTGDRPGMGYESLVMHWHGAGRSRWNGGGKHGVFVHAKHDAGCGHGGMRNEHPTQKPLKLMNELVHLFTNQGETVLDPFMGSGSTGVSCVRLGRKFIGIEKDRAYFDVACRRISEAVAQPDMFIDFQPLVA